MKRNFKISLLCSAILLAGCGDNTESSGTSNQQLEGYLETSLARATTQKMLLQGSNASVPLSNNLLFDSTDGTLAIPTGGDESISNPKAALNYADGFSTSMPIYIEFEGDGFGDTPGVITSGVTLLKLSKKLTDTSTAAQVPTPVASSEYTVYKVGSNLAITPNTPFDEKSEYLLVITDDVTDVNGNPVGTSQSYAALKTATKTYTTGDLASAQTLIKGQEAIATAVGVDAKKIVYSAWFTTTSVGDVLASTATLIGGMIDAGAPLSTYWNGSANPNNVDLTNAYNLSLDTSSTALFDVAIAADANFKKYLGNDSDSETTALISGIEGIYALNTPAIIRTDVNVTKGTIQLPYFLETDPTKFSVTPFASALDSLAVIKSALTDRSTSSHVGAELVKLGLDPTNLSAADVTTLMGKTLTKDASGTALDSERLVTQYSPVPQIKSLEAVDVLLFTPTTGTPSGVVIYQHGITSVKENAYAFAANLTAKGLAVIAIDHPIHGSRSLAGGAISTNDNALYYLNLSALPVARDNIRQSALDVIGLRMALEKVSNDFTGTPLANVNASDANVKFMGHSLGGITGFTSVATSEIAGTHKFSSAVYANSGGHIAELLFASETFGPEIKHNLAKQLNTAYKDSVATACATNNIEDGACYTAFATGNPTSAAAIETELVAFKVAAQTLIDTVDPHSLANTEDLSSFSSNYPTLLIQSQNDKTVPNTGIATSFTASFVGSEGLDSTLGLTDSTKASPSIGNRVFVQYNETAKHSTIIGPKADLSDATHTLSMRDQVADFLESDSLGTAAPDALLE
ncbi:VolA/Pla-1 family phospholipase [Vibrio crassostreae]|uniref:VolA/Pla-1 family phospholipase n=1 Tax=Vibrio crassostreae TaxID=246167 RepID=UPI000F4766A1|nr:VolA/Pla-1 family phospholipase [Vibrio crassostreae]ROO54133.1 Pla-1/cef family extracellular lipase [Vibrio crassostreae]ROO65390.1 Pla-1/cef family extracellular lipase [Vibrio crassostreae]ROO69397.1 Pla-1/cef family extracellular lipase [Vibrio crassostreae]ROO70962.1 Pla-1/cef family extracellular lipase [Vibrio crassostreae]ROR63947.1 Pla-1/cef family extracellular lipase [Vibrio crassostreae]